VRTLTANEFQILEAMVETMIPSDELGPGAREAQVARYIDNALAFAENPALLVMGLEASNEYSQRTLGARFVDLDMAQRSTILADIERNRASGFGADSTRFFGILRALVIEGMFCDPTYGGNASYIGWKLIGYPGHMLEITPQEQQLNAQVVPIYERPGHQAAAPLGVPLTRSSCGANTR
jgi:gluconate 2-dehydrogenase gamma chain